MSAFHYEWRIPQKVKADVAADEFARIEQRDGCITAESLLDESRPEEAVLHPCYTWDDEKAAEKWRVQESRMLLGGLIKVHTVEEPETNEVHNISVRAYNAIENVNAKKRTAFTAQVYKSTEVLLSEKESRAMLLDKAYGELKSFQKRYASLCELATVLDAISETLGEDDEQDSV